jgi:nucleoid-associated protein YgaU
MANRRGPEPSGHVTAPTSLRRVNTRESLRPPESAFTTVGKGESLRDISLRVYGTETAHQPLWLANRDQLSNPNAPIRAGSILRTPWPISGH